VKLKRGCSYWVTRDSDVTGELVGACDVWRERPQRLSGGDGWIWLSAEWSLETRVGTASLETVRKRLGTVPDTDRECIRFEVP
jgi:hypothetical protein